MPRYEDPEFGEYYVEIPDADQREALENILWSSWSDVNHDAEASRLFQEAFFNDNASAYRDLVDYLWDEYGIDFEDAFEWADFREWYDAA